MLIFEKFQQFVVILILFILVIYIGPGPTRVINVEQIMDSVAKLKLGKSDCSQQLFSDNIINGPHTLYVYISLLFSCMLVYGSPPA